MTNSDDKFIAYFIAEYYALVNYTPYDVRTNDSYSESHNAVMLQWKPITPFSTVVL